MVNTEYPDLPFVPPRAFGTGRAGYPVQYVVIHYTAGSERSTSAEDGAAYDQRRTDGTSTHYFVDSNSVVQCVYTRDRANAAFHYGNRYGIQYELCGTVQTRAQWLDAASDATLTNAARQIARDCIKYQLPVRRLTTAQMRNGEKGICGHVDVTNAYGLGDHTDPGPEFPWDVLLARINQFLGTGPTPQEDDMPLVFFAKLKNVDTVHLVDSFMTSRFVTAEEFPVLKQALTANGLGTTVWEWPNDVAHQRLLGVNLDRIDDDPAPLLATLDAGQLDALGLKIREGVPSLDQIRGVVDDELDEQSRAGADTDA